MEKVILNANIRKETGKINSKHLRKEGQIPGIIYRGGAEGVNIRVSTKELWHALHTGAGENAIITMNIKNEDGKPLQKTVIVQEVQTDPINDKFVHVDFHEISLEEKIKVEVPIVIKGEAVGVTEDKGVLTQILWELELECLPMSIPDRIDVHVDSLRIGDAIHIKDLAAIADVKFLGDPEEMIVSVAPPTKEEEKEATEEAAEGEEEVEPEIIKKGKKEEEGEEEEK